MQTQRLLDDITKTPTPEHRNQQRILIQKCFADFSQKWKNDQSYLTSPEKLREALDDYEKLQ